MANKRFRSTERAILIAYYGLKDRASARTISRAANISRATLYRHHQNSSCILKDYEDYILRVYRHSIRKYLIKADYTPRSAYLRTLIFISNHREVFKILFKNNHKDIVKKMVNQLRPRIVESWGVGGDLEKVFNVYANEILGIIEVWSRQNFSYHHINQILNDIMYLTKTARQKLLPLQNLK